MSLPDGFVVESTPQNALPAGFEVESAPQASALMENARMLESVPFKALDAIPEMGNAVLSGLSWAGQKIGIGDGTYTPAETFSELEPEWMKPQTHWGDVGADVGGLLAGMPDAPLVAGRAAKRTGEKVASYLLPKVNADLMQAAREMGITPTVSAATGSKSAAQLEQASTTIPFSGARVEDFRNAEASALDKYAKSASGDRETSPNALGKKIKDELEAYSEEAKDTYSQIYQSVVKRVPENEKASIDNLQSLAKIINKRYVNDPLMASFQNKFIADTSTQKALTWHVARDLETKIGEQVAGTAKHAQFKNLNEADLNQMYGALKEDIMNHLLHNHPGGSRQLRIADAAYKEAKETEKGLQEFLGMDRDADKLYTSIFGAPEKAVKTPHPEMAKKLRSVLSPDVMNAVQAEFIARMGDGGAGAGAGFNPAAFATNMEELNRAKVIKELFTPSQVESLNNLDVYSKAVKKAGRAENFSGTAAHNRAGELLTHPWTLGTTIPNGIFARVITNPEFLPWLQRITADGLILQDDVSAVNAKWLLNAIRTAQAEYLATAVNHHTDSAPEVRITIDKGYNDTK